MRITTLLTALCLLLAAAGCSDRATSPDPVATNQTNPEASEVPDDVMELLETNTVTTLDLTPESPENGPVIPSWPSYDIPENADVYSVTFLWGQL